MCEYDQLYVEHLYYFNVTRDYFECHEVLETLWMEQARSPLYQGLLQIAVALYHHRNDNVSGARKMFASALQKLEPYDPDEVGIDLAQLKRDSEHYLRKLERFEEAPFDSYDLNIRIWDDELRQRVEALIEHPPEPHEHE